MTRTDPMRSVSLHDATTPAEDEFAGALLAAARRYAGARSEHDLAAIFFEVTAPFATDVDLTVRMRDPADRIVRSFSGRDDSATTRLGSVRRDCLPAELDDLEGWTPVDGPDADGDLDIAGVVDRSLVVALSVCGTAAACRRGRLSRFVEQLAAAVVDLADRSETARLRLYAGSIVDRTNVPIAVIDGSGTLRLSNDALRIAIGARSNERAASSILEHVEPRDRHRALVAHARALRGRSSTAVELSISVGADGESRMLVDFEPIPLPSGEIESVLVVGRDVTRVRQLEDQVTHADRLATLGQLAAGVVHELNNPLTSILVYTEYLLRKAESVRDESSDTEKLRRILGAAERIQDFARNLVAYSRAERGDRELLSMSSVLDQSVAFCEPLIDRKRVMVIRAHEDVPDVPAVRGQLQQIFINLITNGIQAVAEGSGKILISIAKSCDGWVEIRFDDNGPGVPDDRREEIFRPFVTTKPTGQGTGLGLSIVRNLVERHGGTIEVRRATMGGASFVLAFPVKPTSEPPPPLVA